MDCYYREGEEHRGKCQFNFLHEEPSPIAQADQLIYCYGNPSGYILIRCPSRSQAYVLRKRPTNSGWSGAELQAAIVAAGDAAGTATKPHGAAHQQAKANPTEQPEMFHHLSQTNHQQFSLFSFF